MVMFAYPQRDTIVDKESHCLRSEDGEPGGKGDCPLQRMSVNLFVYKRRNNDIQAPFCIGVNPYPPSFSGVCRKVGDRTSFKRTQPKITSVKTPTRIVAGESPIRNGAAALLACYSRFH